MILLTITINWKNRNHGSGFRDSDRWRRRHRSKTPKTKPYPSSLLELHGHSLCARCPTSMGQKLGNVSSEKGHHLLLQRQYWLRSATTRSSVGKTGSVLIPYQGDVATWISNIEIRDQFLKYTSPRKNSRYLVHETIVHKRKLLNNIVNFQILIQK